MSRWIDADALEDSIIEKWGIDPKYLDDSLDALKDAQTLEWINSAPTIEPKTKVIAQVAFDEDKLREIVHEAVERIKGEYDIVDNLDAVSVVRCSECKYNSICNHNVQHTTRDMSSVTIGYKSVDYCSYGERRDDEQ